MTTQEASTHGDRTFLDEIQSRWPDASLDACETILWMTPFPAGSIHQITTALDRMRSKWGANIDDAINGEMAEFDATMKAIVDKRKEECK
jgi:hypothetical protein